MAEVRDIDKITQDDLSALDTGAAHALRWPRFVDPATAVRIADRLVEHPSLGTYRNTEELQRVGESHYETHDADGSTNAAALDDYLAAAERLMVEIRAACEPDPSPIDQLLALLDTTVGARRAVIGDRPMFAGIVRVFPEGTELLPHNDNFARDAPDLPLAKEITAQFAANIYLQVPEEGGELELWGERPDAERLAGWAAQGSRYGIDRTRLPEPATRIAIDPGDLILIDATRLHAVRRQRRGRRVGMSCFLGRTVNGSLICWS